jgi:hypothetical protein
MPQEPMIEQPNKEAHSTEKIHTMPAFFREGTFLKYRDPNFKPQTQKKKPAAAPKKNMPMYIGIGVAVVLLLVGGGFYVWQQSQQSDQDLNLSVERRLQEELRQQQEAEAQQAADAAAEEQALADRVARDEQRVQNINEIQVALEKYFDEQKKYPENLISGDSLSVEGTIYLESIPVDPAPEVSRYNYVVAPTDALSYTISFSLEEGVYSLSKGVISVSSEQLLGLDGSFTEQESKRMQIEEAPAVFPSLDTDQDGLTDVEETLLYTTDKDVFDSDGDTYSDKQELLNLYNPSGNAPITLLDSGNVDEYENSAFGYAIYYPLKWNAKSLDGSDREVLFTSTTNEFIQVIVEENPEKLSLQKWFAQTFGEEIAQRALPIRTNKNALIGIRGIDQKTAYFGHNGVIYIITHNTGNKEFIDYGVTFEMMVKSFRLLDREEADEVVVEEEAATEGNAAEEESEVIEEETETTE